MTGRPVIRALIQRAVSRASPGRRFPHQDSETVEAMQRSSIPVALASLGAALSMFTAGVAAAAPARAVYVAAPAGCTGPISATWINVSVEGVRDGRGWSRSRSMPMTRAGFSRGTVRSTSGGFQPTQEPRRGASLSPHLEPMRLRSIMTRMPTRRSIALGLACQQKALVFPTIRPRS